MMKIKEFKGIIVILSIFWTLGSYGFEVNILSNGDIPQYEMLEIGLVLPESINQEVRAYIRGLRGRTLNPFNNEDIFIKAIFTAPSGRIIKKNAFYFENYERKTKKWKAKNTSFRWLIRFSPEEIGEWRVRVSGNSKGQYLGEMKINFNCSNGDSKGFLKRDYTGEISDRYLKYDKTGEVFFALGENLAWSTGLGLKSSDYYKHASWIKDFAANGGNFIRLGMVPWAISLEWNKLGDYSKRMNQAWEMDQILDLCDSLDVYVNLVFDWSGYYNVNNNKGNWYNWNVNPYKTLDCYQTNMDFFRCDDVKKYYKRRLAYISARWGYSKNISVYEFFNEVEGLVENYNTDRKEREEFNAWFREMKGFMKDSLNDRNHMYTTSFMNKESVKTGKKVFVDADISVIHYYGFQKEINPLRFQKLSKLLSNRKTKNQPVIIQEMGASHYPSLDLCTDVYLHKALWSTTFSGSLGAGMNWWWEINHNDSTEHIKQYKALSQFLRSANFEKGKIKAFFKHNKLRESKSMVNTYYLINEEKNYAMGWINNTSHWWANLKNTNQCIKSLIENDSMADNKCHNYDRYEEEPRVSEDNYLPLKMKKGEKYRLSWFSTKTGKEIIELRNEGYLRKRLRVPHLGPNNYDYAFIIDKI